MKKFFSDFKTFVTRGNVLDMAVGVIVGGAFSAIVTALNGKILMPVVNWALSHIPGMESGLYTILPNSVEVSPGTTDAVLGPNGLSYSVLNYIDWSAFFEAIINFLLIAMTLFVILKVAVAVQKARLKAVETYESIRKVQPTEEVQVDEPIIEEIVEEPIAEEIVVRDEPKIDPVVVLLEEIRDALKSKEEK